MNTKLSEKIIAVLTAFAMMVSFACVGAFADEVSAAETITAQVSFYDGEFKFAPLTVEVYDGIAEDYGFEVAGEDHNGNEIDYITVFDVLVAAHASLYGDDFSTEDYIGFSSHYTSKIFGVSGSISYTVNDAQPNDGIYNELYGSYTGFSIDEAPVSDGDKVMFYTLQDSYWSDYNTVFDANVYCVSSAVPCFAEVSAVCLSWYGSYSEDVIAQHTVHADGVKVLYTQDFENFTELGVVEDGQIELAFEEEGTYYIVTEGAITDDYDEDVPIIGNYAVVEYEFADSEIDDPVLDPVEENLVFPFFFFFKDIDISFDASSEGRLTLVINIVFTDLLGNNADRLFNLSINLLPFAVIA